MNAADWAAKSFVIGAVTIMAVAFAAGAAEKRVRLPNTIPVTGMKGWAEDHNRVTGLTLTVEDAGWPLFSMLGHPDGVIGAMRGLRDKAGHLNPIPAYLGCAAVGANGKLTDQQVNEVSNTLTFSSGKSALDVTITRLSPAVLLESDARQIELFASEEKPVSPSGPDYFPPPAGTVKPLRWATPGPDGEVLTGVLGSQPVAELPMKGWEERHERAKSLASGQSSPPPLDRLGETWLLLWYGSDSPVLSSKVPYAILPRPTYPGHLHAETVFQADIPVLLVFGNTPTSIDFEKGGPGLRFVISFPGRTGKIAMMPLFGHDIRPAEETEQWLGEFPEDVRARCDSWASRLCEFPVDVREDVTYDAGEDRITFTEKFRYVRVRRGGERMAPLQAMLALAHGQGLPVTFSAEPIDMKLATQFGPVMGIPGDRYSWSMGGLGRYVNEEQVLGPPNPRAEELTEELSAEVDKVLDAGHLAPWYVHVRKCPMACLAETSETLCLLSQILPVLPQDQQMRLRRYLESEYKEYPPEKVLVLDYADGTDRQPGSLTTGDVDISQWVYRWIPLLPYEAAPTIYRAYGVQRYYAAVGKDPPAEAVDFWREAMRKSLEGREWDTLGWFWGKYANYRGFHRYVGEGQFTVLLRQGFYEITPVCVHRDFAGLIGYLRLCEMAGRRGEAEAWGQLARLAALRFALLRYGRYASICRLFKMPDDPEVAEHLAREGDSAGLENHVLEVADVSQHRVFIPYGLTKKRYKYWRGREWTNRAPSLRFLPFIVPELGRYLQDHAKDDVARYLDYFGRAHANWYLALPDTRHTRGSEVSYMRPHTSHQLFMAHAWIAETAPERLERYIDEPWAPLGDLYYMHKLAETIKAYRGVMWLSD